MKQVLVGMVIVLSAVAFVNAATETFESTGEKTAASEQLGVDVTLDFFSKYVWRGQIVTDDWVMQPGATMGFGDLTLGIWGNVDMTNENDEEWNFIEVDYIADYSSNLTDGIIYSLGYIYYQFPQGGDDTQEIYGGLTFDTMPLDPTITWYYDVDEIEGSYVSFEIGHSLEMSEDLGLDIGLNIGWGDSDYNVGYFGVNDDGFNDLTLSVGLPLELGGWSVTPSVNYVHILDSDISKAADENDVVFAGISLGTSF